MAFPWSRAWQLGPDSGAVVPSTFFPVAPWLFHVETLPVSEAESERTSTGSSVS